MTYDRPTDPTQQPPPDDTDVVEPQPVAEPAPGYEPSPAEPVQQVEPEPIAEPAAGYVPPPAEPTQPVEPVQPVQPVQPTEPVPVAPPVQPAASQVNVNTAPAAPAPAYVDSGPGLLYWARRVVSLLFAVLFVLLGVRIFLILLVADPNNDIVNFVYNVTEPFVAPFRGMFQFDEVTAGQATLDIAAVAALIGWLLIYVLIMALLRLGDSRRR